MEKNIAPLEEGKALVFLYEASKRLSSSLDYEETLRSVAQLVVPELADWCIIDTLSENQALPKRLIVAHEDPERVHWANGLRDRFPIDMDSKQGLAAVLRTGKPEIYPQISAEMLRNSQASQELIEVLREANLQSVMILPLAVHGKVLGAITFASSRPGFYRPSVVALGEELASRAAFAVEHARLFRALQKSERTFRATADSAPVLIWMTNTDGEHFYFNKQWLDFTGRTLEQEVGSGWLEGVHPDDREERAQKLSDAFASKDELEMEYRLRRTDGNYRWLLDKAVPRYDGEGQFAGYTGSCIDITDRNEAVQSVKQLNEELEQRVRERTLELQVLNADLEAFSYSVSHDLRAPLRSIKSFAWLLQEEHAEKLDDEGRDNLRRILASAKRMSQLIEDLLAFAKIGRSPMKKEAIDLSEIAQSVCHDIRREERCSDDTQFVIAPQMVTYGDPKLLRVALENLIGNACKFSSKREAPVIEIGEATSEKGRSFYVKDNGVGFDPTYAHKLFEPFERLHSSDEYAGSGIGLPNVVRIINRHGGTVWAEAELGLGATFYFTLGEEAEKVPSEGLVEQGSPYSLH